MKILKSLVLTDIQDTRISEIEIEAGNIAAKAQPGQFVILMVNETGERIPLTIVSSDPKKGVLTLIFQEIGYSTKLLGTLKPGDSLYSLTGPLGRPTLLKNYGKVIVVGGGVGIAEILPVVKALKQYGNKIYSILGARTKELLILKDEIKNYSDGLYLTTDDGSLGEKGFVSMVLERILKENSDFQWIYCVGPLPMMRVVSKVTMPFQIKTTVCLNTIMLDGTGMCGSCRLTEAGKVKFCCVDGPEFDGHQVDFEELIQRQGRFISEEKRAMQKLQHKCKIDEQMMKDEG